MEEQMKEICTKLDKVLLEYMDLISIYQENWQKISKDLEGGYLQLAHAKYTMGPGRLSQNQYDGRMQAVTRSLISGVEEEILKNHNYQFTLINWYLVNDDIIPDESESNQNNNNSSTLRRRNINESETESDITTKTENSPKKQNISDPIHWFGLLVPSTLKESQKYFKQSLVNMVALLNIRNEILMKEVQFKKLKKEKEIIMQELTKSKESIDEGKKAQENTL
ncbi:1502_t:CDS:2 [Funneliformis geosporum]|uniref:Vacuolar ATPase assembly protein VMA22 n=1 Tax=Funneliformis geosporum TaxID=1117311 RepID=A0A9W4SEF3_9GLOM|nr:1502_t:CDS:2 [Funneliformis geosporum]